VYLYGRTATQGGQTLARLHVADHTEAARGYNFGPGHAFVSLWTTTQAGEVFALVRRNDDTHTIHRSTDYGVTFTRVLIFGDNGAGGQVSGVRLLHRGLAEVFLGGTRTLLAGEYNVHPNANRAPGSLEDRVRIMTSVNGIHWTQLYAFNTDGLHHTRHIHMVAQDPVTRTIYFGLGDGGSELGIIGWDGLSPWPSSSLRPSAFKTRPGFSAATNRYRYWITDMLFPQRDGFVYTGMEGNFSPRKLEEEGLWRHSADLLTTERVYPGPGQSYRGTGIRLGVLARGPNGGEVQIWSDVGGVPGAPNHIEFFISREETFEPGARSKARPQYDISGTGYQGGFGLFTAGGRIYASFAHRDVVYHSMFYQIR
jgi:hypothetical protein